MFGPLTLAERSASASGNGPAKPWLTPIVPVPEDAPACAWRHPQHGKPVAMWPYHDAGGRLVAYAARVEYRGADGKREKDVLPITYCRVGHTNGLERCAWRAYGVPASRPLYRLLELLADRQAPVIVTEGEKKADAVPALFPGFLGTTSMGGANAAKLSDWTSLAGRRVIFWPDNDEAGHGYAEDGARLTTAAGAASVAIVTIPADWPEGWDLADPLPDGAAPETLARVCAEAAPWTPTPLPCGAVDDGAEIARLAALPLLAYEREREAAAERLGCRVSSLDKLVEAGRRDDRAGDTTSTAGRGRRIEIADIEPWPEPVDGAALIDETAQTIRQYVILSKCQADAVALWTHFTHAFDSFDFSPKLVIRSPEPRSGKTRLVEALERLVRRPFFVSGISGAALLRIIEQHAPAMLLDEIDTMMKGDPEKAEALRGLVNSGFDRAGARHVKNVPTPDGGFEPRAFSTWCPMLLAGIGTLPDTVADRSVIIAMKRKRPDEKVKRLRARDGAELRELGRKAARWAADNGKALETADPEAPAQLHDRAADAWTPLFSIAELAGGEWPGRARRAAIELSGGADGGTIREKLLSDIRTAFDAKRADRLSSDDLVAHLIGLDDRPWPEFVKGKPLTKAKLAHLLRPLEIRAGSIRLDDGRTPKGYYRHAFEDAFARYLPSPLEKAATTPQPSVSAAFGGFQNATSGNGVAFQNCENPSVSAGCGVVADRYPPAGDDFCEGYDRDPEEATWTE
jgi:putative DNA primase/helicase